MQTNNVLPCEFHRGTPSMRDYTPAGAVTAGDMIAIDGRCYVAHNDIAAGQLGALSSPDGSAAYRVTLHTGGTYADGAEVQVDTSAGETIATGGTVFGYAEGAADQSAGDNYVVVQLTDKKSA